MSAGGRGVAARLLGMACVVLLGTGPAPAKGSAAQQAAAKWIARQVRPGKALALDLGCGDAGLAIELARKTDLKIQCVDPEARTIEAARKAIDAAGLYGTRVSADRGDLGKLDYPDYCASLIVCGDEFVAGRRGRDFKEILRVLHPKGVAVIGQSAAAAKEARTPLTKERLEGWLKQAGIASYKIVQADGIWARITRPRGEGWDEWTHRAHDPAFTHASNDTIGGPELKLLWSAAPQPGLASATILVAGGRVIEIGRGYRGHEDTTPYIQVSDAFTGIRLWAKVGRKALGIDRPLLNYSPIEPCSDVVATDELLYVLGGKLCHVLSAASGAEKAAWPIPPDARPAADHIWLYLSRVGERMFGSIGKSPRHQTRGFSSWGGPHWRGISSAVFALDPKTGKAQWVRAADVETASIVIGDGRMLFIDTAKTIHALDTATGKDAWSKKTRIPLEAKITHCGYFGGRLWVMYAPTGNVSSKARDRGWKVAVFSADDGKLIAEPKSEGAVACMTFSGGTVYMAPQHGRGKFVAADARTGRIDPDQAPGPAHAKCTPLLATPKWLLYRHQAGGGFTWIDRKTKRTRKYDRIRCCCHYPGLPAYGLLYVQGAGCNCAHPMRAHVALIPGRRRRADLKDPAQRLLRGEAFGKSPATKDGRVWASWRADRTRSGKTPEAPKLPLRRAWAEKLAGELTPLAVAGDAVFLGSTDRKVRALDAATGRQKWQYIAAGAVRVAPFYSRGKLYFSDDDGWAHCLRAGDGKLVWKFRAALGSERVVAYEEFMSAWPAGCGVLVHDGVAYVTAGYFPQEGGRLYALDAETGKVLWTRDKLGFRRGMDCLRGAMAMGETLLFMPSVGGPPAGVYVKDPKRKPYGQPLWRGAFSATGMWVMTVGDDAVVGSADRQFVHHVATYNDLRQRLPIVTDEAIYLRGGHLLTAEKRSAYRVHRKRGWFTHVGSKRPKRVVASPDPADVLWKARKGVQIEAVILAGDALFSAGGGTIVASDAQTGRQRWSAPAGARVTDLAFCAARLFAVTAAGQVLCFQTAAR